MRKRFTVSLFIISMLCLMGCSNKKEKNTIKNYDSLKSTALSAKKES